MINPLQIRTVSSSSKDEKNPDEEDTANLASHLKTVETFFDLYLEDITASQKALLKDMTIKAYAKYGITFESDIYHLTNNDYPVMKDIYDLIEFEITKLDMKKKRGENVSTVEYNDYVQLRGLMKDKQSVVIVLFGTEKQLFIATVRLWLWIHQDLLRVMKN